jgi:hypothetical protein
MVGIYLKCCLQKTKKAIKKQDSSLDGKVAQTSGLIGRTSTNNRLLYSESRKH